MKRRLSGKENRSSRQDTGSTTARFGSVYKASSTSTTKSFNVWSHISVSLQFKIRFSLTFSEDTHPIFDPFNLPMLSSAIGTVTVYLTSSLAHLMSLMFEMACKTCFFFDYGGISLMTFTSGQVMFFYTRPMKTGWIIFESPTFYFSVAWSLSFLGRYLSCKTSASNNTFSASLRAAAFLAGYLNATVPYLAGVVFCSCHENAKHMPLACAQHSLHAVVCFHIGHVVNMILSGLLHIGRLPERLFPRIFYLIGQSHQLMYFLSAIGTDFAYKMIEQYRKQAKKSAVKMLATVTSVSLLNSLSMLVLNAGIVVWFASDGDSTATAKSAE